MKSLNAKLWDEEATVVGPNNSTVEICCAGSCSSCVSWAGC